jgi:hypothetical protein
MGPPSALHTSVWLLTGFEVACALTNFFVGYYIQFIKVVTNWLLPLRFDLALIGLGLSVIGLIWATFVLKPVAVSYLIAAMFNAASVFYKFMSAFGTMH